MSASGVSVKFKKYFRQRFTSRAPRLVIRSQMAGRVRALIIALVSLAVLALVAWVFDTGRSMAGFHREESLREIQSLKKRLVELDAEAVRLRAIASSGENLLQVERATQKQLAQQVKSLEVENATLKEDLAFFEELMPSSGVGNEATGVRIDNLRIIAGSSPGEFSYRMLVINNAGRQAQNFKGELQFAAKVKQGGKDAIIVLPAKTEPDLKKFRFDIKHFRRLEGIFSIPAGTVVKGVEVRILQDGNVRAQQLGEF